VTHLAKLYIEPTNCCNLTCRTCVRNIWNEVPGWMTDTTFDRIMAGLQALPSASSGQAPSTMLEAGAPPSIFFGGYGEPLAHPRIIEMVAQAKALGGQVELITNGTQLTSNLSRQLIAVGLNVLWVSLDGATPESYTDVRLGAALPEVVANVARFRNARPLSHRPVPEIGIAFVAMKRNIADLPALLRLGSHLGASRFLVTNLLPHTAEMRPEILYGRALTDICYLPSLWVPQISLPKMDINETTGPAFYQVMRSGRNVNFTGINLGSANDCCPFIVKGAGAIGWDGNLSPCLPLLHDHTHYLDQHTRFSRRYLIGNVNERDLADLWQTPAHLAFRERVRHFEFAPCTFCGGCELSLANEEDCIGNGFPTCGGCLWAQGIIQCP
jgi:MoaA/NifB/PqqE/SkfB family radical SAM enzyme